MLPIHKRQAFMVHKNRPSKAIGRAVRGEKNLFFLKAVTASTAFCVARASISYMNFAQSAEVSCLVVLTFGDVATDARVYVLMKFVHLKPPIFPFFRDYKNSMNNF